ncbi:hypothetical protein C1N59_20350 [Pantoea sp. SGAir0183]
MLLLHCDVLLCALPDLWFFYAVQAVHPERVIRVRYFVLIMLIDKYPSEKSVSAPLLTHQFVNSCKERQYNG